MTFILPSPVLLAPMSGVTDLPFRRQVRQFFSGFVVSEMVASKEFLRARPDVVRRARHDLAAEPTVLQIAGTDPYWMSEAARLAEAEGAGVIDINMGCPAKHVAKKQSGSALMRDLDTAVAIVRAVVAAVRVPVTLKMRLGWDEGQRNAAELARRAEDAGVALLTVHGRTRCQFFTGRADWAAIADVKRAVGVPVIANGDIASPADAVEALRLSGCDGVMVGRAATGRPWLLAQIEAMLVGGRPHCEPTRVRQLQSLRDQINDSLAEYGRELGLRTVRKHIAAWIRHAAAADHAPASAIAARRSICRMEDPEAVAVALDNLASVAC